MPKLPSDEELGPAPALRPDRPIATFDATPISRGEAATGAGLQRIGNAGVSIGVRGIEKDKAQAESLSEAQARADLTISSANRKQAISDATEPADLEKTHLEGAQQDLEAAAQRISDPNRRALFIENNRPTATVLGNVAKDRAFDLSKDAAKAGAFTQLEQLKKTAIGAADDATREQAIRDGSAIFEKLHEEGYLKDEEAAKQVSNWRQGYAIDALQAMNPVQRLAAARGGYEGALIQRESSNNPRVVNSLGYAGLYQFGAPLLKTLGLYTPGSGEDLPNWSTSPAGAPGKWSGTFNIPGYPGVRSLADFRENPDAQRAAFQASTAYYDGEIQKRGLDKFIGKDIGGGQKLTREGIYTAAHLGGIDGADQAIRGGRNAADANGSTVLGYARMAAQAGPGAGDPNERSLAKYLSPEQRLSVANGATRDLVQQDRQAQNAQANEVSTVRQAIKDDEASIIAQGAPRADLSPERVAAAMGPTAGEEFARNRSQAVAYHDATNDWSQIPLDEIRARLGTLRPAAGAPGFENAQRLFSVAEQQAETTAKERRTDPAAAADRTPEVRAALQGASLDRPESYQAVAKARAIAQERLRIPEDLRVPMTREEAQQVARPIQLAAQGGDAREIKGALQETLKQLQSAFGEDTDTAFQQVLREAHGGTRTAEQAALVLRKLARGDQPSRQEIRAVDDAAKSSAADRAVAGVVPASAPAQPASAADGFTSTDPETGALIRPAPLRGAPSPTFPTPDPGAIEMLRKHPGDGGKFDRVYGPGASERVLAITGAGK